MENKTAPGISDGDLRKRLSSLTKRQLIDRLVDICRMDQSVRRQLIDYINVSQLGRNATGLAGVPEADPEWSEISDGSDRRANKTETDPIARGKEMLALGRRKEAFDILWNSFTSTLNQDCLRQALALASPSERVKLQSAAFEIVENHSDPDLALCFLSQWGAHDRLALLVERRGKEMSWQRHAGLEIVAKNLTESNPEQAWDLLRLMLVDVLDMNIETEIPRAVRFIHQMARLAVAGRFETGHQAFLQQLRTDHPEKVMLWERVSKSDLLIDSK